MSVAEVKDLPLNEKFQILEILWEEMSEKVEDIGVSKEDQRLLDKRLERIESGEVKIYDWDDVKDSLGKR